MSGNDTLLGGDAADEYHFDQGWGQDRIVDGTNGNIISFGAGIALEDISFARSGVAEENLVIINKTSNDRIEVTDGLKRLVVTNLLFSDGRALSANQILTQLNQSTANKIVGSDFNDQLMGSAAADEFFGYAGNDYLVGNGGTDRYHFSSGFDTIVASTSILEVLVAPVGASPSDLRVFGTNRFGFRGFEGSTAIQGSIEYIEFDDGSLVDLTTGPRTTGTNASEILFNLSFNSATFTPGTGDDLMIGGSGNDSYIFGAGFGNDTIYDMQGGSDQIQFTDASYSLANALFTRDNSDLVISFASASDTLRVEGFFWNFPYDSAPPLSFYRGGIESIHFGDGQTLSDQAVVSRISSKSAGNDWVLEGIRDGGAGDDILEGGDQADTYVFGVGYGHDVIRDGYYDESGSFYADTLIFQGLATSDVTVSRDPNDPLSIIFTINTTGETLRLEGKSQGGFNADFVDYLYDRNPGGIRIESFQLDGSKNFWC